MLRRAVLLAAVGAVLLAAAAAARPPAPATQPAAATRPAAPATRPAAAVPPLPVRGPRVASYLIHVELDPARHTLKAQETITWRNPTGDAVPDLWFHLYLNAFRHARTTFMRERAREGQSMPRDGDWGHIDVRRLTAQGQDLTRALTFERPDDGNADDETVARVTLPAPVPPGGEVSVVIDFEALLPRAVTRTGHAGPDFHFVAQWFPKLGVYQPRGAAGQGGWRCHQFHAVSEFFADYGRYEVWVTVPVDVTVAATGWTGRPTRLTGDRMAYRFEQEDVHDFAFVAARNMHDLRRTFLAEAHRDPAMEDRLRRLGVPEDDIRLSDVDVRLLLPADHLKQVDRFFAAAFHGLADMGYRYGRYPYTTLTIVDPPPQAGATAGMEYPTLISTQTTAVPVGPDEGPEDTTLHELAHQHFYGLLGSDEAEEPWLDEGFASYATAGVVGRRYGEVPRLTTFDGLPLRVRPLGSDRRSQPLFVLLRDVPHATYARGVTLPLAFTGFEDYRALAAHEETRRASWDYLSSASYNANAYAKPTLLLLTLEGLLGEERMLRVLRTYAARHRFGHPRSDDFRRVLAETEEPAAVELWDGALGSREVLDYAVESLRSEPPAAVRGRADAAPGLFESEVVVRRVGGLRAPVEVEVLFEGGARVVERWDGRAAWRRFTYARPARLAGVRVDPRRLLALELDLSNNARSLGQDHRPAARFGAKVLLWLQHVLAFAGGAA
ncbi:MAG TPA: M1 family metallopeptidase [Polyangia bacterium]|jgi:hypothetical protein